MTTTDEDKANMKNDDTNTNTTNAADNDNDDEEQQHQNEQNEQNEQNKQQLLLFESLLIKRIVKFLNYKPYDFAITLLPPPSSQSSPLVSCDETINDDEEDDNNNSLLLSLTPEYRNLLETSIMLIREEKEEEEKDVVNENDNDNEDTPKATATTTATTTAKAKATIAKAKYHLGLEAQNLPFIAKTLRKVYHTTKMKMKMKKGMKLQEDITNNSNKNRNKDEVEEEETKTTTLNLLLFNITSCLLLIQPDHSTVWSDRRRCLLFQIQRRMKMTQMQNNNSEQEEKKENEMLLLMWYNELYYLDLLMTQHSKAPSSWAHRKYVLRQLLSLHTNKYHHQQEVQSLDGNNMTSIQDLVMKEVNGICSRIAEQYPKNYYAWTHRIYVVSKLLLSTMFIKNNTNNNTDIIVRNINNISNFLETELKEKMYNEWLPKHPTDHSAIHYTCQILDHMFDILNQKEEYYVRVYLMEMYNDDNYEKLQHQQLVDNLHVEVVKKKYDLSILALKQVQILLSKYYQSSNSNSHSNCNESLWILRRMTCQIIWKHASSSSYIVIKHHEYDSKNESLRMLMMRQLVRNDIKSVIDSLNIIPTRISSSVSGKEEEDASLSFSLSQLVDDAGNANGDDEKMDATSNKNNIHAWTFLAWCIVNIPNTDDDDDNNDNSNSNDNGKTKRPSSSSSLSLSLPSFSSTTTSTTTCTLFTHDLRETVMRRLQGAEATATTTTATAANKDGSTADATATAATSTTAQHNTRLWTSSSSPNVLLL